MAEYENRERQKFNNLGNQLGGYCHSFIKC